MSSLLRRVLPATIGRAVDARAVEELVRTDPVLARRLERYADTFYTRFDGRIGGGLRALHVTGGRVAALLALIEPVIGETRDSLTGTAAGLIWADALGAALTARLLAEVDRSADPDLAFAVTLLSEIGTARLLDGDAEGRLLWWRTVRQVHGEAREAGMLTVFGAPPCAEAARVALEVGAPEELAEAMLATAAEPADEGWSEITRLGELGRALVAALGCSTPCAALHGWVSDQVQSGRLPVDGAWSLVDAVIDGLPGLAAVFELPVTPFPPAAHLRARADQPGVSDIAELRILAALQEDVITHLRAQATRLEVAMTARLRTDPVTDLLSFQAFVARLEDALSEPDASTTHLVAVDVEDLGELFVVGGLRTTDRLLRRVAVTLHRTFPEAALITRCGPGTFLVACPGDPRRIRLQLERTRAALRTLEQGGRGGSVRLDVRTSALRLADLPREAPVELAIERARSLLWEEPDTTRRWVGGARSSATSRRPGLR